MVQKQPLETKSCPLCDSSSTNANGQNFAGYFIECKRCGSYLIERKLTFGWPDATDAPLLHLISGYTREVSDREDGDFGSEPPEWARLTMDALPSIRRQLPRTIEERAEKLLLALHRKTSFFGHTIELDMERDVPLGYALNRNEFWSMLEHLQDCGYFKKCSLARPGSEVQLGATAFERIDHLRGAHIASATGFVAMSFDAALTGWYEAHVASAIEDAGYRPTRMDFHEHNDQIVDVMLGEIRASKFVVADFTQQKRGVYFEAGFAMGLGLPVIWLVHKDDQADCHFDTAQYNHLVWTEGDKIRERLANRIRATIGQGPRDVTAR